MSTGLIDHVLDQLDLRGTGVVCLKDPGLNENANWLVETSAGERLVLRRYDDRATRVDLTYEHAVLRHLAGAGWVVPAPLSPLTNVTGRWYCATQFEPGKARRDETTTERYQRGGDLARLQIDLRGSRRHAWTAPVLASPAHRGHGAHGDRLGRGPRALRADPSAARHLGVGSRVADAQGA